jgi:hypothetical protein
LASQQTHPDHKDRQMMMIICPIQGKLGVIQGTFGVIQKMMGISLFGQLGL